MLVAFVLLCLFSSLFGGEGIVLGVILRAAIVGVMINGMVLVNLSSYLQDVVLGIVLVIAVSYDTLQAPLSCWYKRCAVS